MPESATKLCILYRGGQELRRLWIEKHHASKKHLGRYVDEFTWRLNEGNVKRHSLERLASFVDAIVGKRLTYARLIA